MKKEVILDEKLLEIYIEKRDKLLKEVKRIKEECYRYWEIVRKCEKWEEYLLETLPQMILNGQLSLEKAIKLLDDVKIKIEEDINKKLEELRPIDVQRVKINV